MPEAKTKENILKAAIELFSEKGYYETSMAAIAEKAGVGKGTLYWYFSSKDEMFKSLITEKIQELQPSIKNIIESGLPAEKAFQEFIRIMIKFMIENRNLSKIVMTNFQINVDNFKQEMIKRHYEVISVVESLILSGINEGAFSRYYLSRSTSSKSHSSKSPSARWISYLIIGLIRSVGAIVCFSDENIDEKELSEFVYYTIFNGIKERS